MFFWGLFHKDEEIITDASFLCTFLLDLILFLQSHPADHPHLPSFAHCIQKWKAPL